MFEIHQIIEMGANRALKKLNFSRTLNDDRFIVIHLNAFGIQKNKINIGKN